MFRMYKQSAVKAVRMFSSELAATKPTEAIKSPAAVQAPQTQTVVSKGSSGGSTFFQRFSSFLAGCGVGFGVSSYFIYDELIASNNKLSKDIQKIASSK